MLPTKPIAKFFLRLVIIYMLLVAPWPGVREAYSSAYRWAASAVFGQFGASGGADFEPISKPFKNNDTEINTYNLRTGRPIALNYHDTRLTGYLLTAETLALILATPLAWSRKWKALLWGLVLVHLVIMFRITLLLLFNFTADSPNAVYHPAPFWRTFFQKAHTVVNIPPSFSFVAPIFIWIVATFRRQDLQRWREALGGTCGNGRGAHKPSQRRP